MMTNPAAAMRMLLTYAILIPLAILVGYLLTEPASYGTLGVMGLVVALIFSPVFIKWHYPIMVFGIGCPATVFFLVGNPPLWEVVVILSLGIAIVERAMNSDRQFIRVPSMTWPLLFILGVGLLTAKLTGGIGLHALGGGVEGGSMGGGKKYVALFCGIAMYFALTSRGIPRAKRNLYIGLFFLAGTPAFIGDLFPLLPSPLNYINWLFPPTSAFGEDSGFILGTTRLGAFSTTANVLFSFMLDRFGLRGIFLGNRLWRLPLFILFFILSFLGGFRISLIGNLAYIGILFFLEGLHRTRLLMIFAFVGILGAALLVPFATKLPYTFQRSLSFLPLNIDPVARADADGSAEWRYKMWRDLWPKVPQYLLLGKGYGLTVEDYQMMGQGTFARGGFAEQMDASEGSLAIANDYHNGPFSTIISFGIWGGFGMLWLMVAVVRVTYRNYKYGDPELKTVNTFLFMASAYGVFSFLFIFGAFQNDVGGFAKVAAFSIALNWGVRGPQREPATTLKPLPRPQPA